MRFLFLARAARYKGLPDVLAALLRVGRPSWGLTVAGGVHPTEADTVTRLLAELPLQAVHMIGQVRHGDVPGLMGGCDVVLVPSRYENFCNVALEALAAGKAVVGARCGGIPDLVLHEWNGLLFEPGDVDGLAGALCRLIANRELVHVYGRRGRARAAAYDWPSIATATENVLRGVAC
ncbi:MAG: glycosyltransferase family 4 protein [Sterolibacterium sp.]